ncbi:general odorant-binding protein 67-like [Uranotaenia lowii]|uniref:general odorant-binding protein 67-like n=1 Tax=Uranotaenia lowii TaxID=190385 RepID=UPI002479E331|nr:general odorant-binding protein 67-like [Uranotaenia lowii]
MQSRWFILIAFLVSSTVAHTPKLDPSCSQLSTTKRARDCCSIPVIIKKSLIDTCATQIESKGLNSTNPEYVQCIADCCARELKLYSNNNKNSTIVSLNKAAVKSFMVETVGADPNFAPMLDELFDDCYNQLRRVPLNHQRTASCNYRPQFMKNCIERGLFKDCPSASSINGTGCDELNEKLFKGCPFYMIE